MHNMLTFLTVFTIVFTTALAINYDAEILQELRLLRNITQEMIEKDAKYNEIQLCRQNAKGLDIRTVDGNYYYIEAYNENRWSDAREFCKSHNMDLISIETQEENDALDAYLKQRFGAGWKRFWIGATDIEHEGTWKWVASKTPLTYNKFQGMTGNKERNCLVAFPTETSESHLKWTDAPCAQNNLFICEIKKPCA